MTRSSLEPNWTMGQRVEEMWGVSHGQRREFARSPWEYREPKWRGQNNLPRGHGSRRKTEKGELPRQIGAEAGDLCGGVQGKERAKGKEKVGGERAPVTKQKPKNQRIWRFLLGEFGEGEKGQEQEEIFRVGRGERGLIRGASVSLRGKRRNECWRQPLQKTKR